MFKQNVAPARGASQAQAGRSQHQPGGRQTYKPPVIDARLFYHPADGRKWKRRCEQKRTVWIAFLDISHGSMKTCAVEKQIGRLKGIPPRTVRWVIRLLRTQGFLRDVRKHGLHDALERELLPDRLGKHPSPDSESCRPSTRESCRVNAVKRLHSEKPRQDEHDAPRPKTVAAGAVLSPKFRIHKPFRSPRQVFAVAVRLIGQEYASWVYYRALKCGREAGKTLAQSVPQSVAYYVKSYRNFCTQFDDAAQQAMLEQAGDRLRKEETLWPDFFALDRVPRQFRRKAAQQKPASQEVQERNREPLPKNWDRLMRVYGMVNEAPEYATTCTEIAHCAGFSRAATKRLLDELLEMDWIQVGILRGKNVYWAEKLS
jgi:hypothetical protein